MDGLLLPLRSRRERSLHATELAGSEGHNGNAAAQLCDLAGLADATLDVVDRDGWADLLVNRRAGSEGVARE